MLLPMLEALNSPQPDTMYVYQINVSHAKNRLRLKVLPSQQPRGHGNWAASVDTLRASAEGASRKIFGFLKRVAKTSTRNLHFFLKKRQIFLRHHSWA